MSAWVSIRFLQTQSDARLLALARDGHERAFEALVHRYRKPLLAYCRRMPVPGSTAEDAVQQGLLQAWVALQRGAEVRDAQPWLYRVVRNVTLRMLNGSDSEHAELSESLVGDDPPQSELERRMSIRTTLAGVAALPPLQREALLRTAVEGFSHEQVAAMLGVSDGAVRGLVYRARATLRNAASALTPLPLVEWMARAGRRGALLGGGIGGGGGAVGLGALVKGGATVTASVFVVGAVVVHPRPTLHERHVRRVVTVPRASRASHASAAQRAQASSPAGARVLGAWYIGTGAASHRTGNVTPGGATSAPAAGSAERGASSGEGGDTTAASASSAGFGPTSRSGEGADGAAAAASSGAGSGAGSSGATAPSSGEGGGSVAAPSSSPAANGPSPSSGEGSDAAATTVTSSAAAAPPPPPTQTTSTGSAETRPGPGPPPAGD